MGYTQIMEAQTQEPTTKTESEIKALWELSKPEIENQIGTIFDEFIAKTSHPESSFHNFGHSKRIWEVSKKLLGSDLVKAELEKYTAENNLDISAFTPIDLEIAFFMLAYTHDLGNSHSEVYEEGGRLKGIPLQNNDGTNQFQKTDAEKRSQAIAPKLIEHYLDGIIDDPNRVDRITKLTNYLIECTIFQNQPSGEKPFLRLVHAIDQSLQTIPESKEENLATLLGLLSEEQHDPNGPKKVDLENLITFPSKRLEIIYPNLTERQKLLELTGPIPDFLKRVEPTNPRLEIIRQHPIFKT